MARTGGSLEKPPPPFTEKRANGTPPNLLNADDVVSHKSRDLFWLGDVYFNQSHTLALTAISTYCGPLCGQTLWKIFEKSSTGQWEERPWVVCSAVSRMEQTRPVLITANARR